ncbi:M15 family metallopeptidase [Legionella sp. W05-934-2]|jgi:D-alanyl-D-alanine dipeptidase|uniref:M15 family metallopeptidase n=1 Tax=Legionella sp. W05-934-2 TaxID=1198649 RepID=UPI0034627D77
MLRIADPIILNIPVIENNDDIVNIETYPEIKSNAWHEIPILNFRHQHHTYVRKTVAEMLVDAQSRMPAGWHIKLIEGHRSEALQQRLFDFLHAQRQKDYPHLSEAELFDITTEVVSPVTNQDGSKNVFPHGTGAAVDIKLVDNDGHEIELGPFPEEDNTIDPHSFHTHANNVPTEQKEKRAFLCQLMSEVGFVNYPFEWWHYSFGDRYWAYHRNHDFALYDLIEPRKGGDSLF